MSDTQLTTTQYPAKYLARILSLVPLKSLSRHYQKEIIKNANLRSYLPGRFIFKQGSEDHFYFYLLEGKLNLLTDGKVSSQLDQDSESSCYPLAQLLPRSYSAQAKSEVTIMIVNRHLLDKVSILQEKEMAESDQQEDLEVMDLSDDSQAEEQDDWMVRMLQSDLFSKIPTANIYKLFATMKPMEMKPKQVIVRQGDRGEHYYVIKQGRCAVLQKIAPTKPLAKVALLEVGDSFGEESLISKSHRNASVVAMSSGMLMRLARKDFELLIKKPALRALRFKQAEDMVLDGQATWLDVRFPSECRGPALQDSINLPIYLLRRKLPELDRKKSYIACCDNGERSSTATFLLAQNGFNAYYLEGGLEKVRN